MMIYRLAGLGDRLGGPVSQIMDAATLAQAVRAAEDLLEHHRDCESVEIFLDNHFLRQVDRREAS